MVVDASVAAEYLAGGPFAAEAGDRLLASARNLRAPHLIDAEVGHALRGLVSRGRLTPSGGRAALDELATLPLQRTAHAGLLGRAWALRPNLSLYDGLYVALAERLEVPLLTLDVRLARASGVRARIELIA